MVLIDDRAKQMREQMPGVTITRQDVLRQIILSALKEERT